MSIRVSLFRSKCVRLKGCTEAYPETGKQCNVSVPSYFIANAHNELYAFYTGKGDLLEKNF